MAGLKFYNNAQTAVNVFQEDFVDIKGYEGIYQISKNGSIRRILKTGKYTKFLKHYKNNTGYLNVTLTSVFGSADIAVRKIHLVHRLVATAFIQNHEAKPEVNHIDGNKMNNSIENLEWCTNQENISHAIRTGLFVPEFKKEYTILGSKESGAKRAMFTEDEASEICEMIDRLGMSFAKAGRAIGCYPHIISRIYNGVNKFYKEVS